MTHPVVSAWEIQVFDFGGMPIKYCSLSFPSVAEKCESSILLGTNS